MHSSSTCSKGPEKVQIAANSRERLHCPALRPSSCEPTMKSRVLQLDSRDNVLVALADLKQGDSIDWAGKSYVVKSDVAAKHKFATADLAPGDRVVMYGVLVGQAVKPIAAGELLTVGNIRHQTAPFH